MANFYSSSRTEPDMREELNNTFDGVFPEIAKKQTAVLRKMRRDSSGDPIPCDCVDILTKEPDKDVFCPVCHSEGFLWDEEFMDTYKRVIRSDVGNSTREDLIGPGLMNIPLVVFYTRSSTPVTPIDKVVELVTDKEGEPVEPFVREFIYRIGTLIDFRSDNGKLEYFKMDCYAEQRKFLNGP